MVLYISFLKLTLFKGISVSQNLSKTKYVAYAVTFILVFQTEKPFKQTTCILS